jgi:pimeloyl-ACP methyl ester carboxylesterase
MDNILKNIYCISGLGADEKAFMRINIKGYELKHLKWLSPEKNETIAAYALRMAEQIPEKNPILLGLSFGGMIAIEIAKRIPVEKVILLSAVKTFHEIPRWMRWSGALRLHRIIPIKKTKLTEKADDRRMGIRTAEEKSFVEHYRRNVDWNHVNWAVNCILTWRNTDLPKNVFHIHGEKDRMFPIKNVRPTHIIKEGTHIMVLNKADEVSASIQQILSL